MFKNILFVLSGPGHKKVIASTAILLLVLFVAPGVAASPPSGVHFEVETSLLGDPSPFVASGPAVDDGIICPSGDTIDVSGKASGFSPNGFNVQVVKQFTCDDGSGDFLVKLQVRIDFRKGIRFNWNVVGGTGDYEDLHGTGTGVGLEVCGADCVLDIYDGAVHVD